MFSWWWWSLLCVFMSFGIFFNKRTNSMQRSLCSSSFLTYQRWLLSKASYGAGTQACDRKVDKLWVRFSSEGMKYLIFSSLWCQDKAQHWVPPLNMQCLQNLSENRKRSVFTLGSLCLLCYMRDKKTEKNTLNITETADGSFDKRLHSHIWTKGILKKILLWIYEILQRSNILFIS